VKYLLLPGLDGTGKLFEPFIACAPSGTSCSVVSYPVDREMSYSECAEFVSANFIPEEPFVIIAESFSGPVAVLVASTQPFALAGVVLCNTFVFRAAWRGFSYLPWASLFRLPLTRFSVGLHLTGFKHASRFVDSIRAANAPVLPSVRASRLRSALRIDVCDQLAGLKVPVIYLRGNHDRLVFSSCVRQVVSAKPNTTVVRVPGPHLLLQVAPQRSWQEVSSFVSSQCLA
jgi:pimeloyl-ACP methyl ester carboxylesterase